jgi:hypothetical protein
VTPAADGSLATVPPSQAWLDAEAARHAKEAALRLAVQANPDPVVQALGRRLGLA